MTAQDRLSEEAWSGAVQAPMLAGFAVTAADPGGLISAFQESAAVAGSLRDAAAGTDAGSLAAEVASACGTPEGRAIASDGLRAVSRGRRPAEASAAAVARLGEIMHLIARELPDQAPGFRDFLLATAERTAEASREGGFLGFGGERVSEAERQSLDDLRAALAMDS